MQRLQFCGHKKRQNNHTIGFSLIVQENTLDMVLCLRGGGKRGAAALKEERVGLSKDDKIVAKKAELNVLLLQLRDLGNATAKPMLSHIVQALSEGKLLIEATLPHLPIETLRKIQLHLSTTNHEQTKIDFWQSQYSCKTVQLSNT